MKKNVSRYIKLHNEVAFLERLAASLLVSLGVYSLYSIYSDGLNKSLTQIETFGLVLSAFLVSKTASRQIAHTEHVIEYERANSLIASTHFLMTIIEEMLKKARFIQKTLLESSPASAAEVQVDTLITFINDIEAGYHVLKDKESHRHLNGTTLVLIWNMSFNIEELKQLAKMLAKPEAYSPTPLSAYQLLTILRENVLSSLDFAKVVDSILVTLQEIDNKIRELRTSIDLPAKLREEYEKI